MTILRKDMEALLVEVARLALREAAVIPINAKVTTEVNTAFAMIIIEGLNEKELEKHENVASPYRNSLENILKDLTPMAEITKVFTEDYEDYTDKTAEWVFYVKYSENLQIATQ